MRCNNKVNIHIHQLQIAWVTEEAVKATTRNKRKKFLSKIIKGKCKEGDQMYKGYRV